MGKNIILTAVTLILFLIGCWTIYKTASMPLIYAIILGFYAILQAALEASYFKNPDHKDLFVFFIKIVYVVLGCIILFLPKY